jgi:hypothetical protein
VYGNKGKTRMREPLPQLYSLFVEEPVKSPVSSYAFNATSVVLPLLVIVPVPIIVGVNVVNVPPLDSINEFKFTLPKSGTNLTFKILTHGDELKIDRELEGLKKINKDNVPELSTRLKYIITSIEDNREPKVVRGFVDNYLLAQDSRALREYIRKIQPDVDLKFDFDGPNGVEEGIAVPITISFFWPDSGI